MVKKYLITLSEEERSELQTMISTGKSTARKLSHARILLLADVRPEGGRTDQEIVDALEVSVRTVERVRQRFVEEGFETAWNPQSRPRIVSKLEKAEADLIELAKSDPPCRPQALDVAFAGRPSGSMAIPGRPLSRERAASS